MTGEESLRTPTPRQERRDAEEPTQLDLERRVRSEESPAIRVHPAPSEALGETATPELIMCAILWCRVELAPVELRGDEQVGISEVEAPDGAVLVHDLELRNRRRKTGVVDAEALPGLAG